jgi:hypothetical protein
MGKEGRTTFYFVNDAIESALRQAREVAKEYAESMAEEPRDPALDRLDALLGEWDTEATHPLLPDVIRGRATFEWLAGRRFLIWRSETSPGIPSSIAIIGGANTAAAWPMHYFDERGITRVYQVSMDGGIWRVWRDHPGFSQRLSGVFEDGGRTIRMTSELQQDGPWKPDLQATYRRR